MAAALLGYARDKQAVVKDLVRATTDSNDGVRNNAVRALAVFSAKKKDPPRVPFEPIIALLDSPIWTDLNKASFALLQISEKRDSSLFAALNKPARKSLADIAHWHSRNHALPGYLTLGRLAGFSDAELLKRWQQGDTEGVIRAALEAP
jgi:HEAT repeat protein